MVSGKRAFFFPTKNTKKTYGRLFAIEEKNLGAVIDTQLQMKIFEILLQENRIPWLKDHSLHKRNARVGESLIDYLLISGNDKVYLEIKSAVLRNDKFAMYPDCPSVRGQKHIRELTQYVKSGGIAYIVFMAALTEISGFKPNQQADPLLHELLLKAQQSQVRIKSIAFYFNPSDGFFYVYNMDLPVILNYS
jgi:sugar fermentation stimulation protein A